MGNIPNIRFKGYTDDWEQRKLSELGEIMTGSTPSTSKSEYYSEDGIPWVTPTDINAQTISDTPRKLSEDGMKVGRVVPANTILCTCIASIGKNTLLTVKGSFNQQINSLTPYVENDAYFLLTESELWSDKMKRMAASGTMQIVNKTEFSELTTMVPKTDEQKKIGQYFSNLDNLIALHQRKCEETKELKKYMLQKMFPKKGEKKPEIRFAGFTDDWEQCKFSDYYKMSSGYAFKMSDYCEDGIGLINGESIQHGIINDDNLNHLPESFIEQYPDFILKEGDIVVGLNRPITNGNLKIARIPSKYNDSLLYQRAGKVVYKEECDRDFSYVLLSQEILKHTLVEAVGSDQPFISTSKLDKWQMMIPKDIEEQHKIGEYFSNIDNLITLHQRKCDELKEVKKFMLQNMFPKKG